MSTTIPIQTGAIVVLDASGSMAGQENRVVSSMNEYVAGLPSVTRLQVYMFDSERWDCYFNDLVETWQPMQAKDYYPGKMTPLYDAVSKGVALAATSFPAEAKVMVMIDTDGMENASREHSAATIQAVVDAHRAKGWEFLFMSQGLDHASSVKHGMTGQSMGMAVQNYSAHNREVSYQAAAGQTRSYFSGAQIQSLDVDQAVEGPKPEPEPEPVPAGRQPIQSEVFFG